MVRPVLLPLLAASALLAQDARTIHRDALVFDAHVHMINRQLYKGGDIGQRADDGQVDLPRAKEGGLDAMLFSLFVSEEYYPPRFETRQTLRLIDLALRQIAANSDRIELALNASDVERIARSGRIAAVLDLEGGFDLDGDLGVLRVLHRLGLRAAQLPAHNWANAFAESCCASGPVRGLSVHGRSVVEEMNRLGILINISHASDATIDAVLETSKKPVVATHHGLRSFNDIPRTMSDDLLRKLASKGGQIGFHIGCEFHNRPFFEWRTKQSGRAFWDTSDIAKRAAPTTIEEIDRRVAPRFPMVGMNAPDDIKITVDQWIAVVERAIEVAGEDHVTLGSDWDGGPTLPRGMRDIRDLPVLTETMLRRGWSRNRIHKFLGGNLLRVFRQVTEGN